MIKPNLTKTLVGVVFAGSLLAVGRPAWADETSDLKAQVQALQNQVNALEAQDPFAQMLLMQQQMQGALANQAADFNPRMDMQQTPRAYVITADLPGMDKDKIDVEVKNGILTISGQRQSEQTQNNQAGQYYRQERSFGTFMQAIPLPDDAMTDRVGAQYRDGVLKVTIERRQNQANAGGNQKITVN